MDLEKRMASLERQVRLYKRLGLLAVMVMAGSLIAGAAAPTPQVIEAEKFVLKNSAGRNLGVWTVDEGDPRLMFRDKKGKRQILLGVGGVSTGLAVYDQDEKGRVFIGNLLIAPKTKQVPGIGLFDERFEMRVFLSVDGNKPILQMYDSTLKPRVRLSLPNSEEPLLEFLDSTGKTVWSAPAALK